MGVRSDYKLPHGFYVVPNKAREKIPHRFYYNDTYLQLMCVVLCDDAEQLNEHFGIPVHDYVFAYACDGGVLAKMSAPEPVSISCVYIVLNPKEPSYLPLTHGVLAHEVYHVVKFMLENIKETNEGGEQGAYMAEWIADKVYEYLYGDCIIDPTKWLPCSQ